MRWADTNRLHRQLDRLERSRPANGHLPWRIIHFAALMTFGHDGTDEGRRERWLELEAEHGVLTELETAQVQMVLAAMCSLPSRESIEAELCRLSPRERSPLYGLIELSSNGDDHDGDDSEAR